MMLKECSQHSSWYNGGIMTSRNESIFVTKSSMPPFEEYANEIRDIWDTHWLTNMGVKHNIFREKLCEYLEINNIDLFTNGHMSLELSLQALNLQGEVITTPFTFASTTHAIVRNGLTPVFCDINADDYTIDVTKIEKLITDRTCAIMPVHVYGNICNIEEIDRLSKKYDLKVIYDACHSFGAKYKGISTARFGDVSCFSFHATKVFNSIEGGAACFKDDELGRRLYDLKNFGIHGPESVEAVGANAKMNEFCAAMGICNLRHLNDNIAKRKTIDEKYRERLDGIPGLKLNVRRADIEYNYAYFPIFIEPTEFGASRNEVMSALAEKNIYARKYFYPLTSEFECFHGKYDVNLTPVALNVSRRVLTLPMYADLSLDSVDKICNIIVDLSKMR